MAPFHSMSAPHTSSASHAILASTRTEEWIHVCHVQQEHTRLTLEQVEFNHVEVVTLDTLLLELGHPFALSVNPEHIRPTLLHV